MDNKEIKARFQRVESSRYVVMQQWDDIRELILYYRGDMWRMYTTEGAVDWRENRNVFDGTANRACNHLASSLHSNMTSPVMQWFELQYRTDDLKDNQDAVDWLQQCGDIIYTTLQESNFNQEVNESYLDMCGFGTTVILEEEIETTPEELDSEGKVTKEAGAWEGIVFTSIPIKEIYFEDDIRGNMINFYRLREMTALAMVKEFGEEGVPANILEKANMATDTDTKWECIYCIYERRDKPFDDGSIKPKDQRRFGAKWILRSTCESLGEEDGYYSMPGWAMRFRKTSGSQWGNSPGMWCLPDCKTLNEMIEMEREAIEKDLDPMILVNERAFFGSLDNKAGAFNVVKDINGFKTFDSGANYSIEQQEKMDLRNSIQQTFYSDQLILKESPQMTATEARFRYQMIQQLMAPTVGRMQSEFLSPMILRTFNILMRAGKLPPIPQAVKESSAHMDIEFVGALSQAQKRDTVLVMDEYAMGVMSKAELIPENIDIINWDKFERDRALRMGVPMDILNSTDEVDEVRDERKAQQKAMQEAAFAQEAGKGMKDLAEGTEAINNAGAAPEAAP